MRAGKLDRRVTIQRATIAPNGFNEPVETWTDVATVWAQQRPNRGAERFSAQEINGQAVMTFHIRYRTDLRVSDRIIYGGRVWNVIDIREVGRRVVTEFDAVAEAAA
jgi:SPP1 family predicted phage head-tail adaptor